MKKIYIISAIWAIVFNVACNDTWDNHYSEDDQKINGNEAEIVDMTAVEYLSQETSYSEMYKLLKEQGMIEMLESKDQQFTIMVYNNNVLSNYFTDDYLYLVKNAICDIAYTPSKITDGLKILMWNDKYLTTSVVRNSDGSSTTYFDDIYVVKAIKTTDAFIYELESPVFSPKSIYEIIDGLDGDFSLFRDMIMSQNEEIFDEANSVPKGVNNAGQTVYDTLTYTYNPLYETFNFSDEFVDGTILIPSNSIIQQTLQEAYTRQAFYTGKVPSESDTLKYKNWIIESAFYKSIITPEEWESSTSKTSAFSKVWRTDAQKLDLSNPVTLSNGMAYYITEMKIPNNVIIYRIKHFFHYWLKCTQEEKAEYFVWENIDEENISCELHREVGLWTPLAGVWPEISNTILWGPIDDRSLPYSLDFTCLTLNEAGDGVQVAMIPPGEYELRMGFTQHKDNALVCDVNIYVNDVFVNTITLGTTTTFHYDRGNGSNPEGYPSNLNSNYDRDGGLVGTITVEGTELQKMVIRIESDGPVPNNVRFDGHHWCLKPTSNNY